MKKVIVVGSLNYDIFLKLSRPPRVGETANAESSESSAGGKGANQAVQIAKLGVPVSIVGKVGNDRMGTTLRENLTEAGVDCTYLKCSRGVETGMGIVDVFPDGSVMAVISHGANYTIRKEDIDRARQEIEEAELVVLQLEIPVEMVKYTIDLAKELGAKVLLNAAPAAALEEEYIGKCDYVVVNEVEASFYAGESIENMDKAEELIQKLSEKYGNCWVCTLGKYGSLVVKSGKKRVIPAVKTEVVETTGAGDSFVGGFSYGILEGMNEFKAAELAAYCSAVTIRNVGAQISMPCREQLKEEYHI